MAETAPVSSSRPVLTPARLAATALAMALAVTGCGSSAPKIPPLPELKAGIALRTLWTASVGRARDGSFMPVYHDGNVYAAAGDGTVMRIDAATGREIWRVSVERVLNVGVGTDGKLVAVGTPEGEVIALGADGKRLWSARVSSEVQGVPLVFDDLVVVRSADARVFAFEASDGKRRWVFQRAAPALVVRTPASAVGQGGLIYAGFAGGKLAAIAAQNGGLRWEGTVSSPKGATELERVSDVVGAPWLAEREVCAVSFQGRAACFDTNTGSVLWARDISSRNGLGGDPRVIYVSDDKGVVVALNRSTGSSLWRQDQLVGRVLSTPLALGGAAAVGDVQGQVHVLARDTGALLGRAATDGTPIVAAPIAIAGGFLVQTAGGALVAFATPAVP